MSTRITVVFDSKADCYMATIEKDGVTMRHPVEVNGKDAPSLSEAVVNVGWQEGYSITTDQVATDLPGMWAECQLPELTDEAMKELGEITTRNENGEHFTQFSNHWGVLEQHGLIAIDRPRHPGNGLWYDQSHWTVEVTERGREILEAGIGLTAQQQAELGAAIGKHIASASNPCGVSFYYDQGEENPYRISDDWESESFATYDELLEAARKWKELMGAEE